MSVPAFRNSKSKVRRRRSHQALKPIALSACEKCKATILPHHACKSCGFYKGRNITGGEKQVEKTLDKATKAKKPAVKKTAAPKVAKEAKPKAKKTETKK